MSISLLILSWAVAPYDLAARVTASKRSSLTKGVASCTKSNSPTWKEKRETEVREGKLGPDYRLL